MNTNKSTVVSMATALLFVFVAAQARFLQTDPVGYEDDANLYAYVGNDPLNKTDPTGMICSGTLADGNASCKVDTFNEKAVAQARKDGDIAKGMERQIARLEKNMTTAYKAALGRGDQKLTLKLPGGDKGYGPKGTTTTFKASELTKVFQSSKTNVETAKSPANPGAVAESRGDGTWFYPRALDNNVSSWGQQNTFLHEGIHQSPDVSWLNGVLLEGWPRNHNEYFDETIKQVIGPGNYYQ